MLKENRKKFSGAASKEEFGGIDNNGKTESFLCDETQDPHIKKGLRFAVIRELLENALPDVKKEFEEVIETLNRQGYVTDYISIPETEYALSAYYIIACAEAASNLGRYDGLRYGHRSGDFETLDEMFVRSRTEGFGKEVKKRIMFGNYVLAGRYYDECYKKACRMRERLSRVLDEVLNKYDCLISPTVGRRAFKIGELATLGGDMYRDDLNTVIANVSGLPAMSVPAEMFFENRYMNPLGNKELSENCISEKPV